VTTMTPPTPGRRFDPRADYWAGGDLTPGDLQAAGSPLVEPHKYVTLRICEKAQFESQLKTALHFVKIYFLLKSKIVHASGFILRTKKSLL